MDASIAGIVVTALLGGSGGVVLSRWLTRSRGEAVLVAISREAVPGRRTNLSPELQSLLERSRWGDPFNGQDEVTFQQLREGKRAISRVANEQIPNALREVRRLREEIPRTTSRTGKTQIAFDMVTPLKLIRETVAIGLKRGEITLALSDPDSERIVPVADAEFKGAPSKVMKFPTADVRFSYESAFAPFDDLQIVSPFVEAASRFDTEALLACLDYVERILQTEADIFVPLLAEVRSHLASVSWVTEVVLVNRGDRALVIHAYGALITRGTERTLAPLPLRINNVVPVSTQTLDEKTVDTDPDRSYAYISVAPQSTVTLRLESDREDEEKTGFAALEAIFDQGLLDCSIVLLRQGRTFPSRKKMQSDWVRFGKSLGKDQSSLVLNSVSRAK